MKLSLKKFLVDTFLNLVAIVIPIITIQLLILPIIGRQIGNEKYGVVITLISIITIFSQSMGNSLNNSRLIKSTEGLNEYTDYNKMFIIFNLVNIIMVIILTSILIEQNLDIYDYISIVLISALMLARNYMLVWFRIKLDYSKNLIENLFLVMGYFIGLFFFRFVGYWQIIYLIGYIFSFTYLFLTTPFLKEGYKKTNNSQVINLHILFFLISAFILTSMQYLDKIIIYPLMNATSVSVYYTSTVIGKIIIMIAVPIGSVLLSYITKMESFNIKNFNLFVIVLLIISVPIYFVIIILSKPLLQFLYPLWADDSLVLIPYVTIGIVLQMITTLLNPIILKFRKIKWQIFVNIATLIIYVSASIVGYYLFELIGFALGIVLSQIVRFVLLYLVFILKKEKKDEFKIKIAK